MEDETLICEGCGQEVDELLEDDGMNLLCKICIALPDEPEDCAAPTGVI